MSWKIISTEDVYRSGYFRLRLDRVQLADGRIMPRYYVVEFPDWIHIVAVDENGQMILVYQYRHAAQDWFLEVPGGSMDPHRAENPEQAAIRELAEETGFVPGQLKFLGVHYPNPALQSNKMHTFLALNCRREKQPQLDEFEELEVRMMPVSDVYQRLDKGEIQHSLMGASLALARAHLLPENK